MSNPKLWRLTLDTNPEDCNLHCTMCEEHSPFSQFKEQLFAETGVRHRRMPQEWLAPIFLQAVALGIREIIPSTMGEPLIYKHFDEIITLCQQHGIRLNLTTNATFPRRSATAWAKLLVPITSDVKFSWNGATAATASAVMLGINFEQALQNVKDFIAVRDAYFADTGYYCRCTFQLTFMQNNMHELADIIRLAAELGIDRVKGHQLWTHFEEIEELSFRKDAASIARWNHYVEEAYRAQSQYLKPNGQPVLLENIQPLAAQETDSVPEHYVCPFLGRELWISATGNYAPCCAPDKQRRSLGDFGSLSTQDIYSMLNSEAYRHLAANYKTYNLCKTCLMRKPE